MPGRMRPATASTMALVTVLVAVGCGHTTPARVAAGSAPHALVGSLDVLAAASLTEAFTHAASALERTDPALRLRFDFAGTPTLVAQIRQGAPADVFASADTANMEVLAAAGLVETPVRFAANTLEIAVAPGNPKHIAGLADLARAGVSVVLAAPGVPAGDYTRQALAHLGVTVRPESLETDVKSALAKVSSGEADATVVYVTDVRAAGSTVSGVAIPRSQNVIAVYPIAVVKGTHHHAAAEAFVRSAVSGAVQRALEADGFLAP